MKTRQYTRILLATVGLLLAGGIILALIFVNIPADNEDVLQVTLGVVLGATVSLPFNFYFGTSESSAAKTELLAERPTGYPGDPVHTEEE